MDIEHYLNFDFKSYAYIIVTSDPGVIKLIQWAGEFNNEKTSRRQSGKRLCRVE